MLDTPELVIASNEESLGSCNVLVIKDHSHGAIFSECDCIFFYITWNGLYGCQ